MTLFEVYGASGEAAVPALRAMLLVGVYDTDGSGTAVLACLPLSFPTALVLFGESFGSALATRQTPDAIRTGLTTGSTSSTPCAGQRSR